MTKTTRALDAACVAVPDMTPADFYRLAMECLDQAGLSVEAQGRVTRIWAAEFDPYGEADPASTAGNTSASTSPSDH